MKRGLVFCGLIYPFAYFAVQVIAAPFYPGYDFLRNVASDLGSPQSNAPAIFNIGTMVNGVVGLAAALGFCLALPKLSVWRVTACLLALTVAVSALGSIWAGVYPLPDPRHGENPLGAALFALPVVVPLALWRAVGRLLRLCFAIDLAIYAAVFIGVSLNLLSPSMGWFQRLFAAVVFVPVAVAAVFALQTASK